MKVLVLVGGKVFSGAEITTLRFAGAFPRDWEILACVDESHVEKARAMVGRVEPWASESASGDTLLRASHFIGEPEQENPACRRARENLAGFITDWKPDVVVCCMYPVAMLALPVLEEFGVPLVVHHQLMYKDLPNHPIEKPVRRVNDYARNIVAASRAVARPLVKMGALNVRIVYAELPGGYGRSRRGGPIRRFLAVGTWGPVKGLEDLIRAADMLWKVGRTFVLDIAGPLAAYSAEYERRILQLAGPGLKAGYIRLLGPSEDPGEYYAAADVLVVPSCEPDPFPTVTLEGMAYELPIVATSVGGLIEQVEPDVTGLLVPARNPTALAEACMYLMTNPHEARQMGIRGRQRQVERFSLEGQARAFCATLSGPGGR